MPLNEGNLRIWKILVLSLKEQGCHQDVYFEIPKGLFLFLKLHIFSTQILLVFGLFFETLPTYCLVWMPSVVHCTEKQETKGKERWKILAFDIGVCYLLFLLPNLEN